MKVLLVEPPKRIWELMGDCISPPLGLAQLAAVLEGEGIPVDIVDCSAQGIHWSALQRVIDESRPNVIGATAYTPFFYQALEAMSIAKRVAPQIITVLGGPHVTFTPEETLLRHPEVDFIVRGEGERSLVDLLRCLERVEDPSRVKGIALRQGGEILLTPPQPLVDVNELPLPAYHLLPMEKYYFTILGKFATIISSRGCPFRCTFCSEWRFWGNCWRPREPKRVVDEMELLNRKYGRESFWFGDDCFNVSAEHVKGICDEIAKRGLDVSWFYQGRADLVVRQKELLPQMRRCGNLMVQIGIESSTDGELARFNKNLTMDQVKEAIDLLKRNDIISQGLMIVGTREDNADSIIHKVHRMKRLDPDFPIFTVFTPFPGSDVYEEAKANGWIETYDYSIYDMSHAVMSTEHLSRDQLTLLIYWCFSSYYIDPVKVAKGLFSRNSWKRGIWRHMMKYVAKQILRSFKLR